ncbi:MAG: hypothetical protein AAGK05_12980, partial [Pseudomonadota bacterium]
ESSCYCFSPPQIKYSGRCKPGKFGIELFWAADATNSFPLNFLVYIGQNTLSAEEKSNSTTIPEALVMKLVKPYLNLGRNVTADNYFSSFHLCKKLLESNTTYVGTVRRNKRELPPAANTTDNRSKGDSVHFYCENVTLCSFWDKKNYPVLLLSSMHGQQANQTATKPDIVRFYNETKAGVDTLDKLNRGYSTKRKCRRWPYSIFFALLDNACYAALVLWNDRQNASESHYEFKKHLAYELCMPYIEKRKTQPGLRQTIRFAMQMLGVEIIDAQPLQSAAAPKQGRCRDCPRHPDRKVRKRCAKCHKFICTAHSRTETVCNMCNV